MQHNTCPVCRKELPVDRELQQQRQQEHQQRLQRNVQRQPAGLQSFFNALNPFQLFGHFGGRTSSNADNVTNADVRRIGRERMPFALLTRLQRAETALQDAEVRNLDPQGDIAPFAVSQCCIICGGLVDYASRGDRPSSC